MFSHIMIGARDLERMVAFYDAVLAPLGLMRVVDLNAVDEAGIIWRCRDRRWPQFALRRPINGLPATWGNGVQISFAAPSREGVDHTWATAIRSGALDEGAPGLRPRYADDFYAAYCRDPEGNKLCFVQGETTSLNLHPTMHLVKSKIVPTYPISTNACDFELGALPRDCALRSIFPASVVGTRRV